MYVALYPARGSGSAVTCPAGSGAA